MLNARKVRNMKRFISQCQRYRSDRSDHNLVLLLCFCEDDSFRFQIARITIVRSIVPKGGIHEQTMLRTWDHLCVMELTKKVPAPFECIREVYNVSRSGSSVEAGALKIWNRRIKEQVQN